LDALAGWERATKAVRNKIAPGVPAWCFYLSIGTFGHERKQTMVGKRAQKAITPITLYVPKEINETLIEKLFVGQETAETMAIYLENAQEWLQAYEDRQAVHGNGGGRFNQPPPDDDFPLDPPDPNFDEDEIPF